MPRKQSKPSLHKLYDLASRESILLLADFGETVAKMSIATIDAAREITTLNANMAAMPVTTNKKFYDYYYKQKNDRRYRKRISKNN